ncbi:MAG: GWxTD domain-containing protein [Candidatus Eisenbacteria bacterium]|nr:GWxTD domain-containing protein [Candidatus Eisenbacteria bacterium]
MKGAAIRLAPAVAVLLLSAASLRAGGVVNDPDPWEERFFSVILSEEERGDYLRLDGNRRDEWRRVFWAERDPTPTTEMNELELEHQRRVVRAIGDFRDDEDRFVWDDRARAAIRFDFPDRKDDFPDRDGARREIWRYGDMLLWFEDVDESGAYVQLLVPGGDGDEPALVSPRTGAVPDSRERLERAFDRLEIDRDRGGADAARGAERWRNAPVRYEFDPKEGDGIEFIVEPRAAAGVGGGDLLVSLFVPEGALSLEGRGEHRHARIEMRLAAWDEGYHLSASKEETRVLRDPALDGRAGFLVADSLVVPPGPCRVAVRLADRLSGNASSRTVSFDVPDFSGEEVRIGGPILATAIRRLSGGDGTILRRGNRIEPRPGGVFRADEKAYVYFEIYNLGIGRDERCHFKIVYRLEGEPGGEYSCKLGGDEGGKLRSGEEKRSRVMSRETVAERRVSLDLSSLPAGRYTLFVRVDDETTGGSAAIEAPFRVEVP